MQIIEDLEIIKRKKPNSNLLNQQLQNHGDLLWKAVAIADDLVSQIKLSVSADSKISN